MIREIIKIDEEKCNGCGQCVPACVEGALKIINGKAKLVSDVHCDGLGACLGHCPQGALTIERREAPDFDETLVPHTQTPAPQQLAKTPAPCPSGGCPGSAARILAPLANTTKAATHDMKSQLGHWPVQLMLVSPESPFLKNADIVLCSDCVPFAVPDFHARYLAGRAVLVGCPKLDDMRIYHEKLRAILAKAQPKSMTILRMEVPCCGGLAHAAYSAREELMPDMPLELHTISINGAIVTREL